MKGAVIMANIDKRIGIRLRQLRTLKNATGDDVAKFLGISRPQYTAYESGTQSAKRHADRLADYFGVSADYILCRTNIKQENKLTPELNALLDSYEQLNADGQAALKLYLSFLLNNADYKKVSDISA